MSSVAKVVGVAVVAAVVVVGASYWTGSKAEQAFRDAAAQENQYGIAVNVLEYKRGVFGATARTEVTLPVTEHPAFSFSAEPFAVVLEHEITHGPLLTLLASVARIHTRLRLPEESAVQLGEVFGGDPFAGKAPLTVDTSVGWSGALRNRVFSPAFEGTSTDGNGVKVSWGGVDGTFAVNAGLTRLDADITFAGLTVVKDDNNRIQFGRATFKSDMRKPDGYEFVGSGTSSARVERVVVRSNGEAAAYDLENLEFKGNVDVDDEGLLKTEVRFSADKIAIDGETRETIENAALTLAYENIDAKAFDAITKSVRAGQDDDFGKTMKEQTTILLQRKPVVFIKDAAARWPEGETKLDFRLGYVGGGDLGKSSFAPTDIDAELHLSLPRALVARLLGAQIYETVADNLEDGEASEENIQQLVKGQVEQQIAAWAETGLLLDKDGTLRADARFRQGALELNGKEAPLETLLGILPR
ncbi:MAG: YdgA family protein [Azoarcus sp.]|jgi:uncharacterized protein YdgA (DUF945 family)|nr:YdgA family protein [Azoarcus sp.]